LRWVTGAPARPWVRTCRRPSKVSKANDDGMGRWKRADAARYLTRKRLTEAEVAQVVGCAVGTMNSCLARARAALRKTLKDYKR
jgi:hypothetical protein